MRSIPRNIVLLFALTFVPLTVLDIATTLLGIEQGYHELNPHTDTTSVYTIAVPEVVGFLLGVLCVYLGARWTQHRLRSACMLDFSSFRVALWSGKQLIGTFLIFVPIAIALGRILPVTNNLMYLTLGWGIIGGLSVSLVEGFGWSVTQTTAAIYACLFVLAMRPITYVLYRTCRLAA